MYINNGKFTRIITTRSHQAYMYSVLIHVMGNDSPVKGVANLVYLARSSVFPEITENAVLFAYRDFRKFKPDFLVNGKRPRIHVFSAPIIQTLPQYGHPALAFWCPY